MIFRVLVLAATLGASLLEYGDALAGPMTFELKSNGGNCNGCEWVAGEGEFVPGTPKALEEFLQKLGSYRPTVTFHSNGGSLGSGIQVGEIIRRRGLSTSIGKTIQQKIGSNHQIEAGVCESACAFAFLGGQTRSFGQGKLGVHQFYTDALFKAPSEKLFNALDLSAQQGVSALIVDYVFRMGVDPRFVSIASATSPASMHYFTDSEAKELRIIYDPELFEDWKIEAYGRGLVAYSKTQDQSVTATIFCRADRTPRLLLTQRPRGQKADYDAALSAIRSFKLGSDTVSKSAVSIKFNNNQANVEINASGVGFAEIPSNGDNRFWIMADDDAPRFAGAYFAYALPLKNIKQVSQLAFRNCI